MNSSDESQLLDGYGQRLSGALCGWSSGIGDLNSELIGPGVR